QGSAIKQSLFYFRQMKHLIAASSTDIKRNLKSWDESERPREKFAALGRKQLTDAELVAILLINGYQSVSAVDLARQLLSFSGNDLNKLGQMSIQELTTIKGIGSAKAITLLAALELSRRRKVDSTSKKTRFQSSKQLF